MGMAQPYTGSSGTCSSKVQARATSDVSFRQLVFASAVVTPAEQALRCTWRKFGAPGSWFVRVLFWQPACLTWQPVAL